MSDYCTALELRNARAVYYTANHPGVHILYLHDTLTPVPTWAAGTFSREQIRDIADDFGFAVIGTVASIVISEFLSWQGRRAEHRRPNKRSAPVIGPDFHWIAGGC